MRNTEIAMTVFDKHELAFTMIKAGFRTSIVFIHTQLSKALLRQLHKEVHLKSATPGMLVSSNFMLNSRKNQLYSTLFIDIYAKLHESKMQSVDINLVIDAWDIFKTLVPDYAELDLHPQSINEAWTLARDFRCELIYLESCTECDKHYLASDESRLARRCPFCNTASK